MYKILTYCFLLAGIITGCENIYSPDIEPRENVIVADARIVYGQEENFIRLYNSLGFSENNAGYPSIDGATVSITDSNNSEYQLTEEKKGIFRVNFSLSPELKYKIKIVYQENIYESGFEPVLEVPEIDSIYGLTEVKVIREGGENKVADFRERIGLQLYADMENTTNLYHFRFTARKTYQYIYPVEVLMFGELMEETMYAWKTMFPQGTFNIAAPPGYSSSVYIKKHPLFFMEKSAGITLGQSFTGWILYLYQYSLSKSAYDFYKDLNNQLNADGKLFDPLYVQARNNLKCINNPKQVILGNFEITTRKERRYYIRFISEEKGYLIKPIPYFYDIPLEGEQLGNPPDFWETPSKIYPNE